MPTFTVPFEIDSWEQEAYEEPADGPPLAQATVYKTFDGDLVGTSVARVLLCAQSGFLASERVSGTLDGRSGTFVMQHGGIAPEDGEPYAFGSIVPGSGTGELTGIAGDVTFAHDADGARVTLSVRLD